MHDKWQTLQQIGAGGSGVIYKVRCRANKEVLAAKVIVPDTGGCPSSFVAIEKEITVMSRCDNENIVKCLGAEIHEQEIWILMEFCEGGSLRDIMNNSKKSFGEEEIATFIAQALRGLVYLHQHNIVHRDIKAANLLLRSSQIKIGDFGVATDSNQANSVLSKHTRIGSPFWMSPETLSMNIVSEKADIWALGITAIELAEGEPPYSHQHPYRAIFSIQSNPPNSLHAPAQWSAEFNSFIKACLTVDYKSRPSALDLLSHPFLTCHADKSVRTKSGSESYNNQVHWHVQSPLNTHKPDNASEDTIIEHEQFSGSIWERGESAKRAAENDEEESCNETVIVKESLQNSRINPIQSSDRSQLISELYASMERQVIKVREKYMSKIKQIYEQERVERQKWMLPGKAQKQNRGAVAGSELYQQPVFFKSKVARGQFLASLPSGDI